MRLFTRLREDVQAVIERDPAAHSALDVALTSPGLHALWAHRAQHKLHTWGFKRLALMWSMRTRRRTGIEIHPAATIGRRVVIDHGSGIVVGETARIGNDCLLYQGVTLGMTGHVTGQRHPQVGNNVTIGAGSIVLGNIHLGDGSSVGAGAVVVRDVAPGTTVVGIPAKPVKNLHIVSKRRDENPFPKTTSGTHQATIHSYGDPYDENIRWSCGL